MAGARPPGAAARPFNLRLWFALAGFVAVSAIGVVFAVLMQNFFADRMLQREAEVTREFLESIVRTEQSAAMFNADPAGSRQLASFAGHIRSMPDVLRANIYGPDRRILWSSDSPLTGQRFDGNPELEAAFASRLVTEVGHLDPGGKAEHVALSAGAGGLFIEAYIPIRSAGRVIGVVELYKMPNALDAMLRDGQLVIWKTAAVGVVVLFATLYWVVRRGARLIEGQQAELARMETLAAVGQMASAVAHSLRNPMAGIRSSAELLQLDQGPGAQEAGEIIAQVDRLDACVRELLDYARAETPAVQRVDPAELVAEALHRLAPQMRRARVHLEITDRRAARRRPLLLDGQLLAQAVASIATNAIEAMADGGRLDVVLEPHGRGVAIAFADTGIGMAPGELARATEPFFTTKTRGLGLGLPIARRIVERFGGTLELVSTEGAGTTVRIVLP